MNFNNQFKGLAQIFQNTKNAKTRMPMNKMLFRDYRQNIGADMDRAKSDLSILIWFIKRNLTVKKKRRVDEAIFRVTVLKGLDRITNACS